MLAPTAFRKVTISGQRHGVHPGSTASASVSSKMGSGDDDLMVDGNTTTSDKKVTLDGGSGENTLWLGSNTF